MLMIEHTYLKQRSQFGKPCYFNYDQSVAVEYILPNPEETSNYVYYRNFPRPVQACTQLASHEAQTKQIPVRSTGTLHVEGGWPKEVNPNDNEAVYRYRRRVEKDDKWPVHVKDLIQRMDHYILQNNTVNIYQNFFDDMLPTPLVQEYNIRIKNSYDDPQLGQRPIQCLSWSPNNSHRLAAAYSFKEFERPSKDASLYSNVWDIDSSCLLPLTVLKPPSPLLAIEFNPRDPSLLISGLMTGQVCHWDIRIGGTPVHLSRPGLSHRYPATQTCWLTSKSNTEFLSASIDGTVLYWDTRNLGEPTASMVMDFDQPESADALKAVGVTALHFEQAISSRFLVGLENGMVVNVNRRAATATEKLMIRYKGSTGPIVAVERNPIATRNFLTVGDWFASVWADDTREGCLFTLGDEMTDLSGGCWSKSRCSLLYIINAQGVLQAYDILWSIKKPLVSMQVCHDRLTAISSEEDGPLVAVGSQKGKIYLVEGSDDLNSFTRNERTKLSAILDRYSRFQKVVDTRVKEIFRVAEESPTASPREGIKRKAKKGGSIKDKRKDTRISTNAKDITDGGKRRSKLRKLRGKSSVADDPELQEAREKFLRVTEQVTSTYMEIDESENKEVQEILQKLVVAVPQRKVKATASEASLRKKSQKSIKSIRKRDQSRALRKAQRQYSDVEISTDAELDSTDGKGVKKRRARSAMTCPMKVCKPDICCMHIKEDWVPATPAPTDEPFYIEKLPMRMRTLLKPEKVFKKVVETYEQIPSQSQSFKRQMLVQKDTPPNVLSEELREARKELRLWREKVIAKELGFHSFKEKLEEKYVEKEPEVTEEVDKKEITEEKRKQKLITIPKERRKATIIKMTSDKPKTEQERKELFSITMLRAKEQDAKVKRLRYPRISTAEERRSSMDVTRTSRNSEP